MAVNDLLLPFPDMKILLRVVERLGRVNIPVPVVLSVVLVMPVIQIKIVQHRGFEHDPVVSVQLKAPVDVIAQRGYPLTVLERRDPAVLYIVLHTLDVGVVLERADVFLRVHIILLRKCMLLQNMILSFRSELWLPTSLN